MPEQDGGGMRVMFVQDWRHACDGCAGRGVACVWCPCGIGCSMRVMAVRWRMRMTANSTGHMRPVDA